MKHIYAVESSEELERYKSFVSANQNTIDQFIDHLHSEFRVSALPRTIVWTSSKTATSRINSIPIPAYTNDYRIVMCPDVQNWKQIYLKQLDGFPDVSVNDIRNYYENELNQHHVLQILGHEFAHHSDYFIDELYDSGEGIWFEEGMAEYISRHFFLTESEFQQEKEINQRIILLYAHQHRCSALNGFGASTYQNSYADIFYEYWRSFLAVCQIIEAFQGNITAVFQSYAQWYQARNALTLAQWFGLED